MSEITASPAPLVSIDGTSVSPFFLLLLFLSVLPSGRDFVPARQNFFGNFHSKIRKKSAFRLKFLKLCPIVDEVAFLNFLRFF
jgi:hypothetical protein